jgi:hypothetical protein
MGNFSIHDIPVRHYKNESTTYMVPAKSKETN